MKRREFIVKTALGTAAATLPFSRELFAEAKNDPQKPLDIAADARRVWGNWVASGLLRPDGERRFTLTELGEYWHATLISLVSGMLRRIAETRFERAELGGGEAVPA